MTGTAKVKTPKNNAEWARATQKRLDAAENPASLRAGEWVLSTHAETGNLIASHVDGGSVVLATKPAASQSPDEVADTATPYVKLERQATQSESRGSTHLVKWDAVAYQTADWGFSAPGTDLDIPINGVYEVKFHLAFLNASTAICKAVFFVNGVVRMAQEFNPHPDDGGWFQSMYMSETFVLNSGDIVSAGAFVNGSGTFDFGPSSADPTVFTSLSVQLISKKEQ